MLQIIIQKYTKKYLSLLQSHSSGRFFFRWPLTSLRFFILFCKVSIWKKKGTEFEKKPARFSAILTFSNSFYCFPELPLQYLPWLSPLTSIFKLSRFPEETTAGGSWLSLPALALDPESRAGARGRAAAGGQTLLHPLWVCLPTARSQGEKGCSKENQVITFQRVLTLGRGEGRRDLKSPLQRFWKSKAARLCHFA